MMNTRGHCLPRSPFLGLEGTSLNYLKKALPNPMNAELVSQWLINNFLTFGQELGRRIYYLRNPRNPRCDYEGLTAVF